MEPNNSYGQPVPTVTGLPKKPRKNPFMVIFFVLGILFLIAIVAAILFNSNSSKKPNSNNQTTTQATTTQGATKAAAIDVENASNSISQSLSGLNDEQDFAPATLDDKTLGL